MASSGLIGGGMDVSTSIPGFGGVATAMPGLMAPPVSDTAGDLAQEMVVLLVTRQSRSAAMRIAATTERMMARMCWPRA